DHLGGDGCHAGDVDIGRQGRLLVQRDRALGDVDGQIAHPLQIGDHLQGQGDETEVGGGGLAQGQHAQAEFVNLHLEEVDSTVVGDDLGGELAVPLGERTHRTLDRVLDM